MPKEKKQDTEEVYRWTRAAADDGLIIDSDVMPYTGASGAVKILARPQGMPRHLLKCCLTCGRLFRKLHPSGTCERHGVYAHVPEGLEDILAMHIPVLLADPGGDIEAS